MPTVADMAPINEVNATGPMALPDAKHVWYADARDAIERLAHAGRPFTADDVRALVAEPEHPAWWGGIFATLRAEGAIRPVAFGTARTRSRNGGSLKVWRGTAS